MVVPLLTVLDSDVKVLPPLMLYSALWLVLLSGFEISLPLILNVVLSSRPLRVIGFDVILLDRATFVCAVKVKLLGV